MPVLKVYTFKNATVHQLLEIDLFLFLHIYYRSENSRIEGDTIEPFRPGIVPKNVGSNHQSGRS